MKSIKKQIAQGSRQDAIKALINVWLKMPGLSCATCNTDYYEMPEIATCCDMPVVCNNMAAYRKFNEELINIRATRSNKHASNKDMTMRLGVSIPANLYLFLNMSVKRLYGEQLFNKEYDMQWFARNFPMFQVPQKM